MANTATDQTVGIPSARLNSQGSATVALGVFELEASIDDDGHLTLVVKSKDGSHPVDIETEVGCGDDELGFRFTTKQIEQDYQAEQ